MLPKPPTFEDLLPTHEGLEKWKELTGSPGERAMQSVSIFKTLYSSAPARMDVFDTYTGGDLTRFNQDVWERPDHYGAEDKETLRRLRAKEPCDSARKTALLMRYLRSTEAERKTREIAEAATDPEIVLTDGTHLRNERPIVFEYQDGGSIKII